LKKWYHYLSEKSQTVKEQDSRLRTGKDKSDKAAIKSYA
jgi:hypothetical protein